MYTMNPGCWSKRCDRAYITMFFAFYLSIPSAYAQGNPKMDIKRVTANDLTTAPTDITGYALLPANTPVDGAGLALPTVNPQWERAPERIVQLAHYLSASPHQRGHLNLTPLRILWLETRTGIFQVHLSEPKPAKGTWVMTTDGHRRAPAGLYELLKESFESLLLTPPLAPHRP